MDYKPFSKSSIDFSSRAFFHSDQFVIVNTTTGNAVESHNTAKRAEHGAEVLNSHNEKNGHPARYEVRTVVE